MSEMDIYFATPKYTHSRWLIISACSFGAGLTGITTAFGLISSSLQSKLEFSDASLALVASIGNVGSFSGFLSGIIIGYIGPKKAEFVSSLCLFVGLFLIWLSLAKVISSSVTAICIYVFITQFGAATASQASSSTSVLVFPVSEITTIASVSKAYYGLAGAIISCTAHSFFRSREVAFVLFASMFMACGVFVSGLFHSYLPFEVARSFDYEKLHRIRIDMNPFISHVIGTIAIVLAFGIADLVTAPLAVLEAISVLLLLWHASIFLCPLLCYAPGSATPSETTSASDPSIQSDPRQAGRPSSEIRPSTQHLSMSHRLVAAAGGVLIPNPSSMHSTSVVADTMRGLVHFTSVRNSDRTKSSSLTTDGDFMGLPLFGCVCLDKCGVNGGG